MSSKSDKIPNPRRRRFLLRLLRTGCIFLVVAVIAIVHFVYPFRLALPAYDVSARQEGAMRFHFLDVGQADCTVVEYPDGGLLLIDGGNGSWESRNRLISYLKGLNIQTAPSLSYVVTHADGDHYGGIDEVLRLFGGDVLYLPIVGTEESDYLKLLSTANEAGTQIKTLSRYQTIVHDSGAHFSCLSPLSNEQGDGNELSTVLYFQFGNVRALFCGDVSAKREERLLEEYLVDETFFDGNGYTVRLNEIDILKVAHHGSANSSSREWLNLLQAKYAVVSSGQGNSYGHPTAEAVSALRNARKDCEVYRTDELGDIVVEIQEEKIAVTYGETE